MSMDKKIEKKKWPPKKIATIAIVGLLVILVVYNFIFGDKSSKLNVQTDRITIDTVKRDLFHDYISFPGTVHPIRTIYLDAVEGGKVEEILIEEGNMVKAGDIILRLSNTNLQLNIMNRESELADQMNNLRNTRLSMEQNKLDLKKQLIELDYLIAQQKRRYQNNLALHEKGLMADDEFQEIKDNYDYLVSKKEIVLETQTQDSIFREVQIQQLEDSVERMQENLKLIRKNLESLNVKAPIDGQLTSINAELGESKRAGERMGQINVLESYKIQTDIDEHYISRVTKGLTGKFEFTGSTYNLTVTKVYPEVQNGRFTVDMEFVDDQPEQMRIGQSFRVKLELGEPQEAVILQRGGFYQSTGGQWVFVVDPTGEFATRRDVRFGGQNPRYYEVLEGLEPNDRVIISTYENFGDAEKLILK